MKQVGLVIGMLVLVLLAGCSLIGGGDKATPLPEGAVLLEAQTVAAGAGTISLDVVFLEGWHINTDAPPFEATWVVDNKVVRMDAADREMSVEVPLFPLAVPVTLAEGKADLVVSLVVYYCDDEQTLCAVDRPELVVPLTVSDWAESSNATLAYTIVPPER